MSDTDLKENSIITVVDSANTDENINIIPDKLAAEMKNDFPAHSEKSQNRSHSSILKGPSAWLSWSILAFSALNVIFLGGKRRAFGVFIAEFHHGDFNNTSLAELNWIGDSYAAVGYLTTTISTATILACHRNFRLFQFIGACFVLCACISSAYVPNAHWLFLTHTVFHGIGSSLILSVVGLVVNEHFDKNHKYHILATTLVSGGSVASIVFVQMYASLIEDYGWRHAFIVLGVIYFFVNSSACFVFQKNTTKSDYKDNKCSMDFRKHVTAKHTPLLLLWTIDRVMTSIVTYGVLLNLADYLRRSENSLKKSTTLTILFAAGEASTYLIGAVITGLTKNFLKNRLKYILTVSTFFMAGFLILWEFVESNRQLSRILAYVSGFCLGPSITFLFPAGEEMTKLPGHYAYPFSLFGMGLGMSLSPTLSAVIASKFKYKWFFLVQGCLILVKFFCLLTIILIQHGFMQNNENDSVEEDRQLLLSESDDFYEVLDRKTSGVPNGSKGHPLNSDESHVRIR